MIKNKTSEDGLLGLDFFVYSSHKTATQSIVKTLNNNGFKCRHCHFLSNIGLQDGEFESYLESYLKRNKRKLNVITIFREPIERHISSFFQYYGTKPLRLKEVRDKSETIIYKHTVEQLQKQFISELSDGSLMGLRESMHDICKELRIDVQALNYDEKSQFGLYETENIKLYVFRFDVLVKNFDSLLTNVTGMEIVEKSANLSSSKWYKDIYSEFRASLAVPEDVVSKIYTSKSDLINLLYPDNFESILKQTLAKYGRV